MKPAGRSLAVAALTAGLVVGGAAIAEPALAWSWDPLVTYTGTLACRPATAADVVVAGPRHRPVTVSGVTGRYSVTFTAVPEGGAQATFSLHCSGGQVITMVHKVTRPTFGRTVQYDLLQG